MSKKASKKQLVEKVSKETGIEEKKLERLPEKELEKLDELVDDVEIPVDEEETELEDAKPEGEEPKVEVEVMDEEVKPRRCVGHHPVTLEKVYR